MEASRAYHQPLRIDVATSQIEGGQAVGWVDPDRVSGCVAFSEPREAFERFTLPHLQDASPDEVPSGNLPSGVASLVAGLKAAHLRLFRENHSLMKEPKWVWVTAACAEEGRIYFVKTQSSWIYLLRGGRAFLIGGENDMQSASVREEALGGHEKLRLQVTSMEVTRDDTVLLVAGDAEEPPDLRAVSRLYAESRDLKRACDGLVNLLGLQGPSAAIVAFRFTPLLSGMQAAPMDTAKGEQVLGQIAEMAREVVLAAREGPGEPSATAPMEPGPRGAQDSDAPGAAAANVAHGVRGAEPAAEPPPVVPRLAPGAKTAAPRSASIHLGHVHARRRRAPVLPILLLVVLLGLLALVMLGGAAWPDLLERARGLFDQVRGVATPAQVSGLVDFTSDPPGALVYVDGERLAGCTPLVGVGLPGGRHEVTMRLGVAGVSASSIEVEPERSAQMHAAFVGTLEVQARSLGAHPQAWLAGENVRRALPARFDGLTAGWYRVFYEDDRIPLWERKVLVRSDEITRIEVNNAFDARKALVRVESLHLSPTDGLRRVDGSDSVYVDRRFVGLAPVELEVAPGLHGVRIAAAGECFCDVLDLSAGASRFVTPQFGVRARPVFRHHPPGQVAAGEPVLLAVSIQTAGAEPRQPQVLLPGRSDGPRALPLVRDAAAPELYVATLEPTPRMAGRKTAYYFSILTPEGEEVVSELYDFAPASGTAQLHPTSAPKPRGL